MNDILVQTHAKHHRKTNYLANHSGYGCTPYSHVQTEDKEWVEHAIQQSSDNNSIHGITRIALKSHLIVHAKRAHKEWGSEQRKAKILTRVRQNGGCTA